MHEGQQRLASRNIGKDKNVEAPHIYTDRQKRTDRQTDTHTHTHTHTQTDRQTHTHTHTHTTTTTTAHDTGFCLVFVWCTQVCTEQKTTGASGHKTCQEAPQGAFCPKRVK